MKLWHLLTGKAWSDGFQEGYQAACKANYEREQRREAHRRSEQPDCPICDAERAKR